MIVLTPDRKEVHTEQDLIAEFEAHRAHGYRQFVLINEDGARLSAVGEGFGPYTLERFPSKRTGTHLKAIGEFKSSEVMVALLDFVRGGETWGESFTWCELRDERPPLPARIWEGCRGLLQGGRRRHGGFDGDLGGGTE
jgi:hypothetical protein